MSRRDVDGRTEPWEATAADIFLGEHSDHIMYLFDDEAGRPRIFLRSLVGDLSFQKVEERRASFERTMETVALGQPSDSESEQSDAESESEEEQA